MKYKNGDRVRIRADLTAFNEYETENQKDRHYLLNAVYEMEDYKDKIVTISRVIEETGVYKIIEDGGAWFWSIGMFGDCAEGVPFDESEWNSLMGIE